MSKKLYLPLFMALIVAMFTSCSKKMGELSPNYFKVTPQVLEAVGGEVPATINGKFPEKYFNKHAIVEVIPVIKWNGGEAKGQPVFFQGEKVEGNYPTISYKNGGNFTIKTSFKYIPEMAKSGLYLEFKVFKGKKFFTIPAVKVADGVIATSQLLGETLANANPANGDDAFQRIIKEKQDASIMFLIQQANIRASELKKAKEFNKDVEAINGADNKRINNIEISAYASPDGAFDLNKGLAENRESNTNKVVAKNLKRSKIDATIDSKYTAEDWEGFKELVSKSDIQDKDLILRVLSMYSDPEQREQEIKNISSVFKTLADEILPQLRRSRLTVNYEIIGKSDEEIAKLAETDPKQLNIEEILYAATLTDDAAKKEAIYQKTTELFPNDFRAYNNLGKLAYQAGQFEKAENFFKKAASVKDAPEANMNLGLIALLKGDKADAETLLGKAAGSKDLDEALGNLYVAQGQYERAVNAFGDTKTNSAALAQILAKDYNKAKNTLAGIQNPDAYTDYLMAVLGARTNNASMVINSMKAAVAKDARLAKKAVNDLEFAKFFTDAAFMSILK